MGILTRAAIKAAEDVAEKSAVKSANEGALKAGTGKAGALDANNKAHSDASSSMQEAAGIEKSVTVITKSDVKSHKTHTEQPSKLQNSQKSSISPFLFSGGGVFIIALIFFLYQKKIKALSLKKWLEKFKSF